MILGCASSYHSLQVDPWVLLIVLKIQLHLNGPQLHSLAHNLEMFLSTSSLRLLSSFFPQFGLSNLDKQFSFSHQHSSANKFESLHATHQRDCIEVVHGLIKYRAEWFWVMRLATITFGPTHGFCSLLWKFIFIWLDRNFTSFCMTSRRSCRQVPWDYWVSFPHNRDYQT